MKRFLSPALQWSLRYVIAGMTAMVPFAGAEAFEILSADPADRSKVESLSVVRLTLSAPMGEYGPEEPVELPQIVGARTENKAYLHYPQHGESIAEITIEPAITYDGTFEVTVPEGYLWDEEYVSNRACTLLYTIDNGGGTVPGNPVQYTLEITDMDPSPGTYPYLETIVLSFGTEVFVQEDARVELKDKSSGMLYLTGRLERGSDGCSVNLVFKRFDTKGSYELVIPKGVMGDAEWDYAHHTGISNPESRYSYTINPGIQTVKEDFVPIMVSPEAGEAVDSIYKISLTFDEPWTSGISEAEAVLTDSEGNILDYFSVSFGDTDESAILTLPSPVDAEGDYIVSVAAGLFCNYEFDSTGGEKGRINPGLEYGYKIATNNVADINSDNVSVSAKAGNIYLTGGCGEVYTIDGRLISVVEDMGHVSVIPGIYIVRVGLKTFKVAVS